MSIKAHQPGLFWLACGALSAASLPVHAAPAGLRGADPALAPVLLGALQGANRARPQPANNRARPKVSNSARQNVNHPSANRATNRRDVNVNQNNVNVNRNVNVNVNNHGGYNDHYYHDWDDDWDDHWHPVATIATAAVAAAVVGSIVRSIPPNCSTVVVNGVSYSQCGSTWYQPQYVGSSVQYVVVNPPR
jgi:hypothetical protein